MTREGAKIPPHLWPQQSLEEPIDFLELLRVRLLKHGLDFLAQNLFVSLLFVEVRKGPRIRTDIRVVPKRESPLPHCCRNILSLAPDGKIIHAGSGVRRTIK